MYEVGDDRNLVEVVLGIDLVLRNASRGNGLDRGHGRRGLLVRLRLWSRIRGSLADAVSGGAAVAGQASRLQARQISHPRTHRHGGHSTVYLGEHLVVKRRTAIKVLPPALDNPTALARFYRAGPRRRAPSITPIWSRPTTLMRTMDCIPASWNTWTAPVCRKSYARGGPLSIERAAHYIAQAAPTASGTRRRTGASRHQTRQHSPGSPRRHSRSRSGPGSFHCDSDDPLTIKFENNNVLGTADYVAPEQGAQQP